MDCQASRAMKMITMTKALSLNLLNRLQGQENCITADGIGTYRQSYRQRQTHYSSGLNLILGSATVPIRCSTSTLGQGFTLLELRSIALSTLFTPMHHLLKGRVGYPLWPLKVERPSSDSELLWHFVWSQATFNEFADQVLARYSHDWPLCCSCRQSQSSLCPMVRRLSCEIANKVMEWDQLVLVLWVWPLQLF